MRINKETAGIHRLIKEDPKKKETFKDRLAALDSKKWVCYRNFAKSFGDMFPSFGASGLNEKIGVEFSDT